jgi:germination protein M
MKREREILCRAALAKTMTQVPGVDYISIYSGNQPLVDYRGKPVGMISGNDFIDSISDVNAYEETELTLYYADESGEMLIPEKREVVHNISVSVEQVVLEELIRGPETEELRPTLEGGTKLLNVSVNENVCYLNFSSEFLNNSLEVRDYIPIYSIVNSLSELSSVNRVQITVNGSSGQMFRDSISLNQLFERNLDYVKQ